MKTVVNGFEIECSVEEFKEILSSSEEASRKDFLEVLQESTTHATGKGIQKRKYVKSGKYSKKKRVRGEQYSQAENRRIVSMRKKGLIWKQIASKLNRPIRSVRQHYYAKIKNK